MIYLAIGCGLLALWFAIQVIRAPCGEETDHGLVIGDVPHLPVGLGNINHIHNGLITPEQETK